MKTDRPRSLSRSTAFRTLATLVFVASLVTISVLYFRRTQTPTQTVVTIQDNTAETPPNEVEPSDKDKSDYQVPPDMPRYLSIQSLGIVNARVLSLGTTSDGAVATPASVYDVGWFDGSAKPDTGGVSLIVGHVSGISAPGVFRSIHTLSAGDSVKLELGNGEILTYQVDAVESFPADKVDMSKLLTYNPNDSEGLNLVTCFGSFDAARQQYRERLVVYTTRI